MNSNYPINIEDIWKATNGGRNIIEEIFPQSKIGFTGKKNFKLRSDDKSSSASVFLDKTKTFWFIQDKGGSDTKAKNAITLLQLEKSISYYDALKYAHEKFCNGSCNGLSEIKFPEPEIKKTGLKLDKIEVKDKEKFTSLELQTLGEGITAEHCADFNLSSLEYYITKDGYKILATDEYPIYYYNYGSWGKIYQPFSKEFRFIYVGAKPENHIFADKKTSQLLATVESIGSLSDTQSKLQQLIICTGPSDALTVYSKNYSVVWFNSETATIKDYHFNKLEKIADEIYNLPDIDITGKRQALELAIKFLKIKTIWLPNDLLDFKDWKRKPCKDIRDFFKYYKSNKYSDLKFFFGMLIKMALPLQPWSIITEDKNGKKTSRYEISNEQTYQFLNANGYYTIDTKTNRNEFSFCRIKENIVEEISHSKIVKEVNRFFIQFLNDNIQHFDVKLINAIHRSEQLKLTSLTNLNRITLDFKSFGHDHDHLFFKNKAVRITASGIEAYNIKDTGKYVLSTKVIPHNYQQIDEPAVISYTEAYKNALEGLKSLSPSSPEYMELKQTVDECPESYKYNLEIKDLDFSIIKYVYNTGRVHWKKEEKGIELIEAEKREQDLHFISKVAAIGYCMFRYKEPGMAYAIYAMETEQGSLGSHRGGTGKSFFFEMIQKVRNTVFIDGQSKSLVEDKHIFSEVIKDVKDFVYFDDVAQKVDLHIFMPSITGKMQVEPKFVNKYNLDFEDSPKLGVSSNHAVHNIDPSIKRRLWFIGFSNYYHTEDRSRNTNERSLRTEFGKNLITNFTEDEMNKFYNFMVWCLHIYLKFHQKINPPMEEIDKRNIQGILGEEFIFWADEYFTELNLNTNIDRSKAFDSFLERIPERDRKWYKPSRFKEKLKLYAERNGWIFNPEDLMKTQTEIERNDIRKSQDGKDVYYFHFRTKDFESLPF